MAEGIIWAVFWLCWLVAAFLTRSEVEHRQPLFSRFFFLVLLATVLGILVSGQSGDSLLLAGFIPGGPVTGMAGITITLLGLLWAAWARVHLGKNWSGQVTIKVDHRLVRTGPYRLRAEPDLYGDSHRVRRER